MSETTKVMDRKSLHRIGLSDLRNLCRSMGVSPMTKSKPELIELIIGVQSGEIVPPPKSNRGRKPISSKIVSDVSGAILPKDEIVRVAFDITKESGIDAVTTCSVAKRLDCSVQQVYNEFENINLLHDAVLEQAMKKYTQYISTEIPNELKITAVGLNYIRFAREYPHLFKLIYGTDRQENVNIFHSSLDDNKNYVIDLLKKEYKISNDRVEDIYIKMGIFCNGIAYMVMSKSAKFDDSDVYRLIKEVCAKLIA